MKYIKERNFIVAYDDEDHYRGKWDILTNQYYGIRGTVVKTYPTAFCTGTLYDSVVCGHAHDSSVMNFLYLMWSFRDSLNRIFDSALGKRIEEVISVGLYFYHVDGTIYFLRKDDTVLNKECVKFINDNHDGYYGVKSIDLFNKQKTFQSCYLHVTDLKDKEWISEVLERVDTSLPTEFVCEMVRRAVTEKVRYGLSSYSFINLLQNWAECLTDMGEEVKAYHNIVTMYNIILWRHEKYEEENYNKKLKENNDKPFLYFEDETYIVRPLLTQEDFHYEATGQNNCVESMYMDDVSRGETYIVCVRLKSNPDKTYITCEVLHDGSIEQFLRKNNDSPDDDDEVFEGKFQEYIYQKMRELKSQAHVEG